MKNKRPIKLLPLTAALLLLLFCLTGCAQEEPPRDAGSMAAYLSEDGLMLYRFDDQTTTLLYKGAHLSSPVFSSDGKYVYFRRGSDMFCAPLDGSRALLAAKNAEYVCADGTAAVFLSPAEGVTRFDPVTGESTVVIAAPEEGYIGAIQFSPDRSRALYTVCVDDVGRTRLIALCMTVPGAVEPDVYPAEGFAADEVAHPVAWTPDGSACVLAVGKPDSETHSLRLFSAIDGTLSDFSGRTPQINTSGELWVSADGTTLLATAYRSSSDLYESLLVLDLAARTYSYLPGGYAPMLGTAVSADGATMAYSLGDAEAAAYGIFVCANSKTLLICGGEGTSYIYPSFFADGLELYFLDTAGEQISLCRAYTNSSGASVLLTGIAAPDGIYCKTLRDTFCIYDTTGRFAAGSSDNN